MLSRAAIKNKAVLMGIQTGDMPDVDFIWAVQRAEGHESCFGNGLTCSNRSCRWRKQCVAMDFFGDQSVIAISAKVVETQRKGKIKENVKTDNFPSLRVDPLRRERTSKNYST
jgi:hypothetical protein